MSKALRKAHILLQLTGPVGSIISAIISESMSEEEIAKINKRISILDTKLSNFRIENYKLVNRFKIRDFLLKVLSEDSDKFTELACYILKDDEKQFENVVNSILSMSSEDLDVLYYNLWKKSKLPKFSNEELKKRISYEYEFEPNVIFSSEYRVNKEIKDDNKNKGLLLGDSLTLAPGTQLGKDLYDSFEKLSFNNLIKISKYIPDPNQDFFETFLCINFTYIGFYICGLMDKIENQKKETQLLTY